MGKDIVIVDLINEKGIETQISDAAKIIGLTNDLRNAKKIFIKPNLTNPFYKKGVTTRKSFIETLVNAFFTINSKLKIYIGEGDGGYNAFSMTDALREMDFYSITKNNPNVVIVNLSKIPTQSVRLEAKSKPYYIDLPRLFFDEIDFSISCPLPKVHCMTKLTLSYKNQWGCVPDTMRLKNHYVFDEIISQISEKLKFKYAFLDGKYGLNNNGPMIGDPIELNWFVASNSLGAFDMVVSGMMGFQWKKIRHLTKAESYGYLPLPENIEIIGNLNVLKTRFVLKRSLWNYPALAAFNSKYLTHLFYISKLSKPLHYIMYKFRQKPIE